MADTPEYKMADRLNHAKQVFTPGAPIGQKDFFSGRVEQISRVIDAIPSPGIHPVIFGQRGVGKTSLANILGQILPDVMTVRISCDGADVFSTIWDKVLRRASVEFKRHAFGFSQEESTAKRTLADFLPNAEIVRPSDVAVLLDSIKARCVFILDEFDRVTDKESIAALADLIKVLSDSNGNVTLVVVGVGKSIADLIGEHPSIQRNLRQIEMPKMVRDEIVEIIHDGCKRLSLTVEDKVLDDVVMVADGFPHYAHLVGLACARHCIENELDVIDVDVFEQACALAADDAMDTLREGFGRATTTSKPSNYARILVACSYAKHDDRGVFRATDVVDAYNQLFKAPVTVQAVVPALGEFTSPGRGPVLGKVPVGAVTQYRFVDPLMRPFLRLKAASYSTS